MQNNNLYVESVGMFHYWITVTIEPGVTEFKVPIEGDYVSGIVIDSYCRGIQFSIIVNGSPIISNTNRWLPDYTNATPINNLHEVIVKISSARSSAIIFRIEFLKHPQLL